MSSLDKLAIRGIRSFDHNEMAVVQFWNPLTVIVGHNGSGKTTIIECLKYATTGDMPPNTKGGAFIHDPSIAGTSEVKAQVKLRFFNSRKEKMLVERRVQVTKKKTGGGLTMKTLEGVISFADDDRDKKKRTSLSTKCASLDEEVPRQLGVSKAILENVIFCHQEESNWPLSEPAALKKKFDDIFEATKYTKALDEIKKLRKDQAIEIKVDKEKLAALKTDRDRAIKLRATIDKLSDSIDIKNVDHGELDVEIAKITQENKNFFNQASKHHDIISKAETLRTKRALVESSVAQARANLIELQDSDQDLARKIETHKEDLTAGRAECVAAKRQRQDEEDQLETAERKQSAAQTAHGTQLAVKQRYLDNLENRQVLIKEIAARHSVVGYDHDLNEEEMREFEHKLSELMSAQARKIQSLKAEAQAADRQREAIISDMKIAKNTDQQARSIVSTQIRINNEKVKDISRKLESALTSVADITYAESSLADERRRKQEAEDALKAANFPEQLRLKASEQRRLEERREQLHSELTSLNLQADVRAKLGLKRTESKRKDEAIQSLLEKHTPMFKKYTKVDPVKTTMEAEVSGVIAGIERDISAADHSLKDATKELSSVETSVTINKNKLKELEQSAAKLKNELKASLDKLDTDVDASVEDSVKEAEEEVAAARAAVTQREGFVQFYSFLLAQGKKEKVCKGCNRPLSGPEMGDFERFCKSQSDRAPAELKSAKEELTAWEKQLADLRILLPKEAMHKRLVSDDIPAAEKLAETLNDRLPAATTRANQDHADLQKQLQELQLLKRSASDVFRISRECDDIARDIAKLESELLATGSSATSEDIQNELTNITDQLRALATVMEKLRSDSVKQNNALHALANSIHSAEMSLNRKQQELKDKELLEKQKEAAEAEVARLESEARELDKKIRDSAAPLNKAQDEAAEARRQFAATETLAARELSGFNKSAEQLDLNAKEIKSYVTRGGDALLAKCEAELQQHERVVLEKKKAIAVLSDKIAKLEKVSSESATVLRNYQDNVQLRSARREIQKYDDDIDALDVESAEKAYRKFDAEFNERRQKQTNLQAHQAKLGGEIETMKKDLEDKKSELKTEYDNIDDKYKTELIKVKTAEVANQDLEKYGKALDSAIMSFHGHKMKEINDTISDLWTKTYQGTDIDKIMIKSDAEGKAAGARTYNYRVVMQKDNTEMDMRGRCSAGQKVLASIIIRLALAESFGTNCGIMALDEPTTNLDQDNIKALAAALSELIKEREGQSNFQLIVITHDEEFLDTLGTTGVLSKYWRVSRGEGGQVSTVTRENLT